MATRYAWLLPAAAVLVALALIGASLYGTIFHQFAGLAEDPPRAASDIRLSDESGRAAALSDLRGSWILLAFGYTTCPDVCPTTLANLAAVRRQLGPDGARVRVVFVTIDPARDTSEVLNKYVRRFDPTFKAFSGSDADVAVAAKAYGVQYERISAQSAAGYLMNHTAYVYVIDPQFRVRLKFPFGVYAEDMTEDMRYLMRYKES